MEENNINNVQEQDVSVKPETPEKRLRIGYVFLSVVPAAVLLMIQTIAQIPFLIIASVEVLSEEGAGGDIFEAVEAILELFMNKYSTYMYLLYVVAGIIVFLIWYYNGFVKKSPRVKLNEIFGTKSIIAAISTAIGLYFFINAVMTLISFLMPSLIDSYNEMIESVGVVSNDFITIVYAIILGPVVEELCFRGVVFGFLEKSGVKPIVIITVSGVIFGAVHLIPVQVVYAAVVGMFLGFLRYRYRSVLLTITTHILFNLTGTYIGGAVDSLGLGSGANLIFGGLALIALVFTVLLVNGDKKAYKPVHN